MTFDYNAVFLQDFIYIQRNKLYLITFVINYFRIKHFKKQFRILFLSH